MAFVHVFLTLFLSISFTLYSRRAYFSQFNEKVDISAPGVSVTSTVLGGGLGISTGTSMATPHVTGAIARVWSVCRSCSAAQVEQCLLSTASGNGSRNNDVGYGLVRTEDTYTCLVETVQCCAQEEEDFPEPVPRATVPEQDSLESVPRPTPPDPTPPVPTPPIPTPPVPDEDVPEPVSTCSRRKENERCLKDEHCCSQKCNLSAKTCSA